MTGQVGDEEKLKSETEKPKVKSRSILRDKLRHIGTPEAPRNDDKRKSID